MGVTISSHKHSIDMGAGGYNRLRETVSTLLHCEESMQSCPEHIRNAMRVDSPTCMITMKTMIIVSLPYAKRISLMKRWSTGYILPIAATVPLRSSVDTFGKSSKTMMTTMCMDIVEDPTRPALKTSNRLFWSVPKSVVACVSAKYVN